MKRVRKRNRKEICKQLVRVLVFKSDKVHFKIKNIANRKSAFIVANVSIHEEEITIANKYTCKSTSQYMRLFLTELKEQQAFEQ
jgi:hypothetical protein